jgi:hypothetical protein
MIPNKDTKISTVIMGKILFIAVKINEYALLKIKFEPKNNFLT